ncbi:TPA: hypothetical protein OZ286_004315 [Escherichia coli]|nr:hypothetical protein [Escherichia coli]EHX8496967.1 hypothetical protein [Escherichia coli]EJU1903990.1 hypothetical protein [Escherichia coli]MDA6135357.1 hypothetical protein [Escherichia coli]HAH6609930.1 hypothetical protein [Escherichia coli]
MSETSKFIDAVKKYYSDDKNTLDFYSELFREMEQKDLLDSNFISQMNNNENSRQRLSELLMFKYCLTSSVGAISSEDSGPDIKFNFNDRKVNIEVVTPFITKQEEASWSVFEFSLTESKGYKRSQNISSIDTLHPRITGSLKEKLIKYKKYFAANKVNDDDINIICINVGFIENIDCVDFPNLKNLFYKQEIIRPERNSEGGISLSIEKHDFIVKKDNGEAFRTSYIDNEEECLHIDGVWLINCNERSFKEIKKFKYDDFKIYENVIYQKSNSKIPDELLTSLSINKPKRVCV